ncbi:acyl-CoA thioesterase [Chloroflexota bacterium]
MEGKTVKESSVNIIQFMTQQDANIVGNVHGGVIMKLIDTTAAAVAIRHTRTNVVTASVDRLDFHNPVFVGDLLTIKASLNAIGKTSMEVGAYVESENIKTGKIQHTASAYLTIVALGEDGRPTAVHPLLLETDEEIRRNREAQARKEIRLRESKRKNK